MGGGEKLDFWRSFFRDLEHDLWTVIDRGIAIAAADYPDKLLERRDGIAEKLFQISCPARGPIEEEAAAVRGSVSRHSEISPAITACDHEYGNSVIDMGSGNRQGDATQEVFKIKKELVDLDKNDDDILELLARLADFNLSIETLKATEIGKPVNNLRKHGCDQIRSAAKKLIRSWKAVADAWAKSLDDVQGNDEEECTPAPPPIDEDELFATTFEMTQLMDLMDNNMATGCSISADESPLNTSSRASHSPMRVSPFHNNSGDHFQSSGLKHARRDERKPPMVDASFHRRKERPQQQPLHQRREKDHKVDDKFAAAKRKLQEGYQQAENAKKNRTVQVMDLMDLPKGTGGPKAAKRVPGGNSNSNNRPPHALPHRR